MNGHQSSEEIAPLAIDLFCGLGGWTEGLLAEGYYVVGFDNERHEYGDDRYPAHLVLQDVLTIHGRQFKDAALIVASPPCQAYSYRAMPWKRAKALPPPCNALFEACFRIQAEASEAAGHHIPLVVENVKGAQKWVGRSRWNFGSFHLWGDVPALMPIPMRKSGVKVGGFTWADFGKPGYKAIAFNGEAAKREGIKNSGGSWFRVAHNTTSGKGANPDGRLKHTPHMTNPDEHIKVGGDGFFSADSEWMRVRSGPKSKARKRASAMIAKIPLTLSRHIAAAWYPSNLRERACG